MNVIANNTLINMSDQKKWCEADEEGTIHVPDQLDPIVNQVGMQMKFVLISGKNEIQAVVDIVYNCQKFFRENPEALNAMNQEEKVKESLCPHCKKASCKKNYDTDGSYINWNCQCEIDF